MAQPHPVEGLDPTHCNHIYIIFCIISRIEGKILKSLEDM